jgi:hypothetical protein
VNSRKIQRDSDVRVSAEPNGPSLNDRGHFGVASYF